MASIARSRESARGGMPRSLLALIASVAMVVVGLGAVAFAGPASATPSGKVRICHVNATNGQGSFTNPYQNIYVNDSSANEFNNPASENGHGTHTGPVFSPDMVKGVDSWGDIIPPFNYLNKQGTEISFGGLNWPQGQAIWENDCNVPRTGTSTLTCSNGWTVDLANYKKNESVEVFIDGIKVGAGNVGADGSFKASGPTALGGGSHQLTVQVKGVVVASLTQNVTCETPVDPTGSSTLFCDSGWSVSLSGYKIDDVVVVRLGTTGTATDPAVGGDTLTGTTFAASSSAKLVDGVNTLTVWVNGTKVDGLTKTTTCTPLVPGGSSELDCNTGWSVSLTGYEDGQAVQVVLNDGTTDTIVNGVIANNQFADSDPAKLADGSYALTVSVAGNVIESLSKQGTCRTPVVPNAVAELTCAAVTVAVANYDGTPAVAVTINGSPVEGTWNDDNSIYTVTVPNQLIANSAVVTVAGEPVTVTGSPQTAACQTPPPPNPTCTGDCGSTPPVTPPVEKAPPAPVTTTAALPATAIVTQPAAATVPAKKPVKVPVPGSVSGGVAAPTVATVPSAVPAGDGSQAPVLPVWALALIAIGVIGAAAAGKQLMGSKN